MENLVFHHGGKEYIVYDALTTDEIRTIMTMSENRNKKLDALNAKSMKKYFEDTDRMVLTILRRCFQMTDDQIDAMEEVERRNLVHNFIRFLANANDLSYH